MRGEHAKTTALIFAGLAALIALKTCLSVDNDLFFHILEGKRVVTEARLPLVEEYSITAAGRPMVATEWLAQTLIYLVYRAGGYGGLTVYHTLLMAATLLILWRTLAAGATWSGRLFLLSLTAFGMLNFCSARIHHWTFLFFAAFLYWVKRWEEGERWPPWAMAACLLPWANMHGGFMAGWTVLGGVCLLDAWRTRPFPINWTGPSLPASWRGTRQPTSLGPWAAGTLACCVHPNGVTAFIYPVWFLFSAPEGRSLILEWKPVDFSEVTALPYLLMIGVVAWAGLGSLSRRFPWGMLTLALLILSLRGRKLLPLFTMSAAVTLSLRFEILRPSFRQQRVLASAAGLLLAAFGWVVLSRAGSLTSPNPAAGWERSYPQAAVEMIARRYPGRRLFHSYEWGGYLLHKLYPGTKVFIDGRLEPYWDVLAGDYKTIVEGKPGWREALRRHRIEVALVRPYVRLAHLLVEDPAWKPVYSDRTALLFVKKDLDERSESRSRP